MMRPATRQVDDYRTDGWRRDMAGFAARIWARMRAGAKCGRLSAMSESVEGSAVVIMSAAVAAVLLAELLRGIRLPVVVLEIALGILVGPQVLQWAVVHPFIDGLSQLGLALLMFLAGFEADPTRIRGRPLNLAVAGWGVSLVLGLAAGALLAATGRVLSGLIVGLALTTTALGTLLPILRDTGLLDTRFGTFVLAAGTVGEFGPIVAIALLLTSDTPVHTALLLVVFVAITVGAAVVATRPHPPQVGAVLRKHLHTSAQLPVRVVMLLILALVWLATEFGLDVLLGAFGAGVIVRLASTGVDIEPLHSKLEGLGFGFLIPVFFVVTGMKFDLDALVESTEALLRLPMFLLLFLLVRGLPARLCRADLPRSQLLPLALMSGTALPLVVVITNIGVETDRMTSADQAALVGAAMVSVMVYPQLAAALLRRTRAKPSGEASVVEA
jgi:Kef-type K+ transport system membrane component KefB